MNKWKMLAGIAILIMTLSVGAFLPVTAAQTSRSASLAAALSHKVILSETSIDGPAFISSDITGQPGSSTVIGWTGTDPLHHLNLMTSGTQSPNPMQFDHKLILPETSPFRPAILQVNTTAGNVVVVAWTGTDPNRSLNVLWNAYSIAGASHKKLTLWDESSLAAPGLSVLNGKLFLAWTGIDPHHSLNVLPLSFTTLTPGTKTILSQFSSNAGPNLTVLPFVTGNPLGLAWTTPSQHLNLASSTDGVHFTTIFGSGGSPQLSASAPAPLTTQIEGGPPIWMAWTGTDPAHFVNLQWTAHYPQWPDPAHTKMVLDETALGGPQIAFSAGLRLAWTGTDPAQHLNVAYFEGS